MSTSEIDLITHPPSVVTVMKHWVAAPNVLVEMDVLQEMREFATSIQMAELARQITDRIYIRVRTRFTIFMTEHSFCYRRTRPGPTHCLPLLGSTKHQACRISLDDSLRWR